MSDWLEDAAFDEEPKDRKPRSRKPHAQEGEPNASQSREIPVVLYLPVRCPNCKAGKPRTTGGYTAKKRRYHVCQRCDLEYLSQEITEEDLEL